MKKVLCCIAVIVIQISLFNCDENVSNFVDDASNSVNSLERRSKSIQNVVNAIGPREFCRSPTREIGEVEMMVADRKQSLKGGNAKRNVHSKKSAAPNLSRKVMDSDIEDGEQEDNSEDIEDQAEETNAFCEDSQDDDLLTGESHNFDENKDDVYVNEDTEEGRALNAITDKEDSRADRKKLHTNGHRKQLVRGNVVKDLNDLNNDRRANSAEEVDYSNSVGEDKTDSLSDNTISENEAEPLNSLMENAASDNDSKDKKNNLIEDNELESNVKITKSSIGKNTNQNEDVENIKDNFVGDNQGNSNSKITRNSITHDSVSSDNVDTINNIGENNLPDSEAELSRNSLPEDALPASAAQDTRNSLTDDSIPDNADKDTKNSISEESIPASVDEDSRNSLSEDSISSNADEDTRNSLSEESIPVGVDQGLRNSLNDDSIPNNADKIDKDNSISLDFESTNKNSKNSLSKNSNSAAAKNPGNSLSENFVIADQSKENSLSDDSIPEVVDKTDKRNSLSRDNDSSHKDSKNSLSEDSYSSNEDSQNSLSEHSDITDKDTMNNFSENSDSSNEETENNPSEHSAICDSMSENSGNSEKDTTMCLSEDSIPDDVADSAVHVRRKRSFFSPPAKSSGNSHASACPLGEPKLPVVSEDSCAEPAMRRTAKKFSSQRKILKPPKIVQHLR